MELQNQQQAVLDCESRGVTNQAITKIFIVIFRPRLRKRERLFVGDVVKELKLRS